MLDMHFYHSHAYITFTDCSLKLHDEYGMILEREKYPDYYRASQKYSRKMVKQNEKIKYEFVVVLWCGALWRIVL